MSGTFTAIQLSIASYLSGRLYRENLPLSQVTIYGLTYGRVDAASTTRYLDLAGAYETASFGVTVHGTLIKSQLDDYGGEGPGTGKVQLCRAAWRMS